MHYEDLKDDSNLVLDETAIKKSHMASTVFVLLIGAPNQATGKSQWWFCYNLALLK